MAAIAVAGAPARVLQLGEVRIEEACGTPGGVAVSLSGSRLLRPRAGDGIARGVERILLDMARSTLDAADELPTAALEEIGHSLAELLRLALHKEQAHQPRHSCRSIMRERVQGFVRRHLRDSSLSIDHIARSFHCTKRYLHKVFVEGERSLNQYIWDLRLDRCAADLASPEFIKRSVTQIAFSWGFSNSSHFSRAFRQRFGIPPSEYRSMLLPSPRTGHAVGLIHRHGFHRHDVSARHFEHLEQLA